MAKQKKQAAKSRKAPAKKAAAKPRKVVEQNRTIEQRVAAEKLTAHKAAKMTAKQARDRLLAERAALPPNFPIIPFADTLVGREFYARVNCKLTPNRKGKLVNRCDTQRVTVVGGATPSAAKPKTKQVFAVQKGQRYLVPDRELRRAVRVPTPPPMTACETYGEQLRDGRPVPAEAWDECPQLPDAGAMDDTSFEPFEFEAPKMNHHGGYHAPGDPLGAYNRKGNRAPQGVPGGTYFSDRADAWIGQTVGGDDYAGEIRARAVALDGAMVDPKLVQAHALVLLGRRDEARRALERVLVLEPGNATARSVLRQLDAPVP